MVRRLRSAALRTRGGLGDPEGHRERAGSACAGGDVHDPVLTGQSPPPPGKHGRALAIESAMSTAPPPERPKLRLRSTAGSRIRRHAPVALPQTVLAGSREISISGLEATELTGRRVISLRPSEVPGVSHTRPRYNQVNLPFEAVARNDGHSHGCPRRTGSGSVFTIPQQIRYPYAVEDPRKVVA